MTYRKTSNVTDSRDYIGTFPSGLGEDDPSGIDEEIISFLNRLKERSMADGVPTFRVYSKAVSFWRDLRSELGRAGLNDIARPVAALTGTGRVHFSWELESSYVEAVISEHLTEVFYEDDAEGTVEGEEYRHGYGNEAKWVARRIERGAYH